MKGYYKRPEATAEAMRGSWFHTGDIGVMDDARYVSVVDRLKDMIIRGGFNVYPREVEEVLMAHPEVSLAAAVGVPDEEYGEEIKAFVVLQEGSSLLPEALRDWSRERLAAYKYPRLLEVVESLPMNATGKILRRELWAAAQPTENTAEKTTAVTTPSASAWSSMRNLTRPSLTRPRLSRKLQGNAVVGEVRCESGAVPQR